MCGIIAIITKSGKEIQHTIQHGLAIAKENKHRGDKDGIGVIDVINKKIYKTILSIDELYDGEPAYQRRNELKNYEQVKKMEESLKKWTNNILPIQSKFLVLHHRKASVGITNISNTHPFKIDRGIYYVHNGSVDGIYSLRNYLEVMEGFNFKSWTDSEVVASLFERFLRDRTLNFKDITTKLSEIFWSYGVLIRVDLMKKELLIVMDSVRTLFLYEFNDFMVIMSEPIMVDAFNEKFNNLYMFDEGIYRIDEESGITKIMGKITHQTKKAKKFLEHKTSNFRTCDCCKEADKKTKTFDIQIKAKKKKKKWDTIRILQKDCCFLCFLNGSFDKLVKETLKGESDDTEIEKSQIDMESAISQVLDIDVVTGESQPETESTAIKQLFNDNLRDE